MGRVCLAYACALMLLCPHAHSRNVDDFAIEKIIDVQARNGNPGIVLYGNDLPERNAGDPFHLKRRISENTTQSAAPGFSSSRLKRQTENEGTGDDYVYEDEAEDDDDIYSETDDEESPKQKHPVNAKPLESSSAPQQFIKPLPISEPDEGFQDSNPKIDYAASNKLSILGQPNVVTYFTSKNNPPVLKPHIEKLSITAVAGKAFSNIIPVDLFSDPEEGTNLTYTIFETDRTNLSDDSWVQFIPNDREIYGLPLEWHISHWNYILEAKDSEGFSAKCPLEIIVQRRQGNINHKFTVEFKLNLSFPNAVDWQIRALEGIVTLFRDTGAEFVTVLDATQKEDICEFVWTNDTIPIDSLCPIEEIMELWRVISRDSGAPSEALTEALGPELMTQAVQWEGLGACAMPPASATPNHPHNHPHNLPLPIASRNHTIVFTATAGHLFVRSIPKEKLYPVQKKSSKIIVTLRYSDGSEVPPEHWLQLDEAAGLLVGLPGSQDVGAASYRFVAEIPKNSSEKMSDHSFVVKVMKPPPIKPVVEYQMALFYPFKDLVHNATKKRSIIENIAALFGEKNTSYIRVAAINEKPTTLIWYNISLPKDRCPVAEIKSIQEIINNEIIGKNEYEIDKDVKVRSMRTLPIGLCSDANPDELGITTYKEASWEPEFGQADSISGTDTLISFVVPTAIVFVLVLIMAILVGIGYKRTEYSPEGYPRVRVYSPSN